MNRGEVSSLNTVVIVTFLALIFMLLNYSSRFVNLFPINTISFSDNINQKDQDSLLSIVAPFRVSGFFGVNLFFLKKAIEKLTWVEGIKVNRVWPSRIHLQVVKRIPIASYNKNLFLDNNGVLFQATSQQDMLSLPKLIGDDNKTRKLFNILKLVNVKLKVINSKIKSIHYKTAQLIQIKTKDNILIKVNESKLEKGLSRFVALYHSLPLKKKKRLVFVDLRYNNGVAVKYVI